MPIWGDVTRPNAQSPDGRYLVHGINPISRLASKSFPEDINLCKEPEKVARRQVISMSLITTEGSQGLNYKRHTKTFGLVGLIIEAPACNVVYTAASDIGWSDYSEEALKKYAERNNVLDGTEILQRSGSRYNEIIARGTVDGKELRLVGFFYKATESGEPYTVGGAHAIFYHMQQHAERLDLPMIPIKEPSPYAENSVSPNRDTICFGGQQYLLAQHDTRAFTVEALGQHSHFASPSEIEAALEWAYSEGKITREEVERQKEAYQQADNTRKTPRVNFHANSIQPIEFYQGYGREEYLVTLNGKDQGKRVHLEHDRFERTEQLMFNLPERTYASHVPLSPEERAAIIEYACHNLAPEQKTLVKAHFAQLTPEKQNPPRINVIHALARAIMRRFTQ